jgi:hypothetical protein
MAEQAPAADAATQLRAVLAAVDAEELSCSASTRHRIEGAALALESLTEAAPAAESS